MTSETELRILLVDDDEVDRMAVEKGLERAGVHSEVVSATDGIEALEILRGERGDLVRRPFVVLLDLNMPRLDGIGFLEQIRADNELRRTVVFVLSTSASGEDQLAAYDRFVAGYVVKNDAGPNYERLIKMLVEYWRVVKLPVD